MMTTQQFAKLTLEDAILRYQLGHLTATGLVSYFFEIKLAYGWTQKFKPEDIYKPLGVGKSAFYKAIATLKCQGFISFEVCGQISVTNTHPTHKIVSFHDRGQDSTIVDKIPQTWTGFHDRGQDSTNVDEKASKRSSSKGSRVSSDYIQINSDLSQISSSAEAQKEREGGAAHEESTTDVEQNATHFVEAEVIDSLTEDTHSFSSKYEALKEDRSSAAVLQNQPIVQVTQPSTMDWLPTGPWKIDGKLDVTFRDWLAKDWMSRYQTGTFEQRQGDVLRHFRKDPANLPIRWEQYQNEYLHRYQNIQALRANDIRVDEQYQQQLIQNHRAVTQVMDSEQTLVVNPSAPINSSSKGLVAVGEIVGTLPASRLPEEGSGENWAAYKEYKVPDWYRYPEAKPEEPEQIEGGNQPASEEECDFARKVIANFSKNFGSGQGGKALIEQFRAIRAKKAIPQAEGSGESVVGHQLNK